MGEGRAARWAPGILAVGSGLVLVGLFLPEPVGVWIFGLSSAAFPVGLIVLGAARRGRVGAVAAPAVVLAVLLVGAMVALLALRGRALEGPWVWGLPLPAAILVYGVGLAPLGLVVLAYALTFDRWTLPDEELERFRRRGPR